MSKLPITEQITFLYTRDLMTTAHFYEEIMGFPLVLDQGGCRIYGVTGDAYLGFCEREEAPEQPQGILFTLVTSEVDRWAAHLESHDVVFEKRPARNSTYNIYHCFVRDPNGYLIEIQRFLDEEWNALT
jgi:catechol 2,3-dioxygenase-like lactoylglutathione lyase family enzyme